MSWHYVARIWREENLKPHRLGTFKISKDPAFAEKVADVVGLYLAPPGGAVVLSIDEQMQVQALDRTQPVLPVAFAATKKLTHDYVPHGTTNLFAALNVTTGEVLGQCRPNRNGTTFLAFLKKAVKPHTGKESISSWTTSPRTPLRPENRGIATDVISPVIAVMVVVASVQDNAIGAGLLDKVTGAAPAMTKAWVNAGFKEAVVEHGTASASTSSSASPERGGSPHSRSGGWSSRHSAPSCWTDVSRATMRRDPPVQRHGSTDP